MGWHRPFLCSCKQDTDGEEADRASLKMFSAGVKGRSVEISWQANHAKGDCEMSKLGIAIHGAGWVAGEHIRSYQKNPHTQVVAIGSRRQESAQARADEASLSDAALYTDFDAL